MPDPPKSEKGVPPEGEIRRPIRWWPIAVILLLTLAAVIWVRLFPWRHRQDQNIAIASVVVIPFLLLLLWCLFFSRLKRKIRLGVLGVVVGSILFLVVGLRFHGVTGDLVPILEWRWNRASAWP